MRQLKGTVGNLSKEARIARRIILRVAREAKIDPATFFSPEEWSARGERYGQHALLVIRHGEGPLARFCDYEWCDYAAIKRLDEKLRKAGLFVECCTANYSGVYKVQSWHADC